MIATEASASIRNVVSRLCDYTTLEEMQQAVHSSTDIEYKEALFSLLSKGVSQVNRLKEEKQNLLHILEKEKNDLEQELNNFRNHQRVRLQLKTNDNRTNS
jgi:hypothetical protein